jgi:type II secretory pathway pseudopilin PulG
VNEDRECDHSRGETLIEMVVAVGIMAAIGAIFVSILAAVAFNANREADRTSAHLALTSAAQIVTATPFIPCAGPADYGAGLPLELANSGAVVPAGVTVNVVGVMDWNGSTFVPPGAKPAVGSAGCGTMQRVDLQAATADGTYSQFLSVGKLADSPGAGGNSKTVRRSRDSRSSSCSSPS